MNNNFKRKATKAKSLKVVSLSVISFFLFFLFFYSSVYAVDTFEVGLNGTVGIDLSSKAPTFDNGTAFVNSSDIWVTTIGDLDNANSTQFDSGSDSKTLNIQPSWLTSFGNTIWVTTDTSASVNCSTDEVFLGNGSCLTSSGFADNLGNHNATQDLSLSGYDLNNTAHITPNQTLLWSIGSGTSEYKNIFVETTDFGTNTITDGTATGNWDWSNGHFTDLGDMLPTGSNGEDLGSGANDWRDIYFADDIIFDSGAPVVIDLKQIGVGRWTSILGLELEVGTNQGIFMGDTGGMLFGMAGNSGDRANFSMGGTSEAVFYGNADQGASGLPSFKLTSTSGDILKVFEGATTGIEMDMNSATDTAILINEGNWHMKRDGTGIIGTSFWGNDKDLAIWHDDIDANIKNDKGRILINGASGSSINLNSGTEDVNTIMEGDTENQLFFLDAGLDVVRLGDGDTNYVQVDKDGNMSFVGKAQVITDVNFTKDVDVKGNFTGNQIYAEMWLHNHPAVATEMNGAGTYENVTGWTFDELNGFSNSTNYTLVAQIAGLYLANYAVSSGGTAAVNDEFSYILSVDDVIKDNCHSHRNSGTAMNIGSITGTCLLRLAVGDVVTFQVTNEDSATRDIDISSANVNLMRIGT